MFEELSRSRVELFSLFCHWKAGEITTIAIGSGTVSKSVVSCVGETRGLPERFLVVRGVNETAVGVWGFEVWDVPANQYGSLFSHGFVFCFCEWKFWKVRYGQKRKRDKAVSQWGSCREREREREWERKKCKEMIFFYLFILVKKIVRLNLKIKFNYKIVHNFKLQTYLIK